MIKKNSLKNYLKLILNKYSEIHNSMKSKEHFRVLEIIHDEHFHKLKIQITGTDKIFKMSPQEIVLHDYLIEGFSKKDIRTITFLACKHLLSPKYKIIGYKLSNHLNKIKFLVRKIGSKSNLEKTTNEISLDKNMLKKMTPEDAHRIGYILGTEQLEIEKDILNNLSTK